MPKSPTNTAADAMTDIELARAAEAKEREFKPITLPSASPPAALKLQYEQKEWDFHLRRVPDDGSCGFSVFGYTREEVREKIILYLKNNKDDNNVLDPLRGEITGKVVKGIRHLPKILWEEIEAKLRPRTLLPDQVLNYCFTSEFVCRYVDDYLKNGWATNAFLYALAQIDDVQLIYFMDRDLSHKPVYIVGNSLRSANPTRIVVLYHTFFDEFNQAIHKDDSNEPLHYDLLIPVDEAAFYAACNVPYISSSVLGKHKEKPASDDNGPPAKQAKTKAASSASASGLNNDIKTGDLTLRLDLSDDDEVQEFKDPAPGHRLIEKQEIELALKQIAELEKSEQDEKRKQTYASQPTAALAAAVGFHKKYTKFQELTARFKTAPRGLDLLTMYSEVDAFVADPLESQSEKVALLCDYADRKLKRKITTRVREDLAKCLSIDSNHVEAIKLLDELEQAEENSNKMQLK